MTSWTTPPPGPEPTPVPHADHHPEPAAPDHPGDHTQFLDLAALWAAEDGAPAHHASVDISEQPLTSDAAVPSYWSRPPEQRTPRPSPPPPVAAAAPLPPAAEPARATARGGYTSAPETSARPAEEPPVPTAPSPQHPHLPAGAHVGDRRGLTAAGAVALALALGLLGAVIDVSTGSGLRSTFAFFFVVGSALAALLAHREDLKATVVMPPLTYCVLAVIGSAIGKSASSGSFLKAQAVELVSSLTTGAPVLYAATGSALLVALARAFRSAQQPSGRAGAPAAARTAGAPPRR